jgi:hypothetical protein
MQSITTFLAPQRQLVRTTSRSPVEQAREGVGIAAILVVRLVVEEVLVRLRGVKKVGRVGEEEVSLCMLCACHLTSLTFLLYLCMCARVEVKEESNQSAYLHECLLLAEPHVLHLPRRAEP